jgi:hypothetical protein
MIPHYRGDGIVPTDGFDVEQTGDLNLPERSGDARSEVQEMVEYYFESVGGTGDLFLPADPPHASDGWIDFCRDIGATWVYTRNLDPEDGWELSLDRIRTGDETIS